MAVDPVSLEVFKNLFVSVAEEMGVALGRTAYSPNIKERRDYSCALFDAQGRMVAQAAHIPVHLGSMPASVKAAIEGFTLERGDVVILNDPYLGGTHLPDVTIVAPVFLPWERRQLVGFVANRGHHADIGGMTPGSLPLSRELYQEGVIIPPLKLAERGRLNHSLLELICRNTRTPQERRGDFAAQLAAARTGERRLQEVVARYGLLLVQEHMEALLDYSERLTRAAISRIPGGSYTFLDYMDDDGLTPEPLPIRCTTTVKEDSITFDFTGTAPQTDGCINAPFAIVESVALYVVMCITGGRVPANDGVRRPIRVVAPRGCLVNPDPQHAVAGGNVETSQRITDVLLGCLAQALPDAISAASQGTMNNLLVGGHHPETGRPFVYYETIAGGMGAGPHGEGASGVHSHMTNTMNTPIEALEFQFPMRVARYAIRHGSGGDGRHHGGDGLVREMEFLAKARVTILSERRRRAPYGLHGGHPGAHGENVLYHGGVEEVRIQAKATFDAEPGDVLSIRTPGGGGWGKAEK
ncbi:MAG: hydantoinase B/oxoprolinase family protein [Chloroflexi bacterium]|nr:hydantoinase B/oxoprolinase family protein [Chloroflexota bacterium]